MQIYPAIDIHKGKCVRLVQGKFDHVTVYDIEPLKVAKDWVNSGATYLHVVDLDGARRGESYNIDTIKDIIEGFVVPVQTGGGIRTMRDVEQKLSLGAARVIIGTAAVKNPDFVKEAVREYGEKIAVGIDAINGNCAIEGWEKVSNISSLELCKRMVSYGIKTIIYTDISKDGMLVGPNIESTREIVEITGINIIASGGISTMKDLENVKSAGASGVIIGKALYQGVLKLKEVLSTFENK